ncbi:MAG: tetratricopeptide repeat protein, partial [Desulfomonilaceae bacterium]
MQNSLHQCMPAAATLVRQPSKAHMHAQHAAALCLGFLLVMALAPSGCIPTKNKAAPQTQASYQLHYQLGINHLAEGQTPQAIKELLAAQAIQPNNADIEHALGLAYQRKGLYDEAIAQYKKALSLDPKLTEAVNNLGTAYLAKGSYDEAIAQFQKCLADPSYSTPEKAAYNLGVAYFNKKDLDKAIEYYEKAILVKEDLPEAL